MKHIIMSTSLDCISLPFLIQRVVENGSYSKIEKNLIQFVVKCGSVDSIAIVDELRGSLLIEKDMFDTLYTITLQTGLFKELYEEAIAKEELLLNKSNLK